MSDARNAVRCQGNQPAAPCPAELPPPGTPPLVEQALRAFGDALPRLLQQRPGQWVAFAGDRLLGFGRTKTELYQRCLGEGRAPGQFLVRAIRPPPPDAEILGPAEA